MSSLFGAVFALLSKLPFYAVTSISRLRPAVNGAINARSQAGPSTDNAPQALSIVGTLSSPLIFLLWILLTMLMWTILPLIFGVLLAAFSGLSKLVGLCSTRTRKSKSSLWRIFMIMIKTIPVVIHSFLTNIILFCITNIIAILGSIVITVLFIFMVERHLNWTIAMLSVLCDCGVAAFNTFGGFLELASQVLNFFNPLMNASVKYSMSISIHIYDGLVYFDEHFGFARRGLSDAEDIGISEALFELIEPFMQVGLFILEAYLMVQTTVIDVFFQLGLLAIVEYFLDIIVVIVTKFSCIIAGGWCSLQEIAYFFIQFSVFGPINAIIVAFGAQPIEIPIACTAGQLESAGPRCAGSVFSFDPPGFYHALLNQRRMLRITCDDQGREWLDGIEISNSSHKCPHSHASFHEYGHAINMMLLDTHECYEICVKGVLYESCLDGMRYFKGSCGNHSITSIHDARRRLDNYFQVRSYLRDGRIPDTEPGKTITKQQLITQLRDSIQTKFQVANIQCDLSSSTSDPFGLLVDIGCILAQLYKEIPEPVGRRLEPMEFPILDSMRHKARLWRYESSSDYRHPKLNRNFTRNPLNELKNGIPKLSRTKFKPIIIHRQTDLESSQEFTRIPIGQQQHGKQRRLESIITCDNINEHLCANMKQCVSSYDQCHDSESYGVITWMVYYIEKAIIFLEGFDPKQIMTEIIGCWRSYGIGMNAIGNPERDPLSFVSIFKTEQERLNECYWCFPMFPPYTYHHTPLVYSLRQTIAQSCSSVSCQCVMFHDLPSATLPLAEFLSADLGYILENGLIFFKIVWIGFAGDWVGWAWRLISPDSRKFSLDPPDIPHDVTVLCLFLHLGSAMVVVFVVIVTFQMFVFSFQIVMFILNESIELQDPEKQAELRAKLNKHTRYMNKME